MCLISKGAGGPGGSTRLSAEQCSLTPKTGRSGPRERPCHACKGFHKDAAHLMREFPGSTAVAHIDYPLPTHTFAADAASIATCAGEAGQFAAVDSVLYAQQASLVV